SAKGGSMKRMLFVFRAFCVAGAFGLVAARQVASPAAQGVGGQFDTPRSFELVEATIPELQAALTTHFINSKQLVKLYLDRFAAYGATLNPFITVNPNAIEDAH